MANDLYPAPLISFSEAITTGLNEGTKLVHEKDEQFNFWTIVWPCSSSLEKSQQSVCSIILLILCMKGFWLLFQA